jgi:membrane protease YdiL (CAAX protease family)
MVLIAIGFLLALLGASAAAFARLAPGGAEGAAVLRLLGLVGVVAGLGISAVGLGVDVFGPVVAGREAARAAFGTHRLALTSTALVIVLALFLGNVFSFLLFVGHAERDFHTLPGFLASALSVLVATLAVSYFRFLRPGVVGPADLGFDDRHASLGRLLQDLATGFLAGGGVLFVSALVSQLLSQLGVQQTQLEELSWLRQLPPSQYIVVFVVGAILAPISEELFFRGIVFRGYLQRKGRLVAYLASATLFACLHLNGPALLPILVLALTLCWLYESTGSIVPSIVAHGVNNGVAFVVLYFNLGV